MKTETKLLNKNVKVSLTSGFVLYGTLVETELYGIWLKSNTETSFISYTTIKDIREDRHGDF